MEVIPTDEELMHRYTGGDLGALGTLYARHRRRVFTICRHLTGDAIAADDLSQESFLRVLRYGGKFDSRSKFTTWLFRVVRNVCHDHLAKQNKETERMDRFANDAASERLRSSNSDSRHELVREALGRLRADQREVLVLSRFENMKYADIAELLDTTAAAVKTRAHRAMRALRQNFSELEREQ